MSMQSTSLADTLKLLKDDFRKASKGRMEEGTIYLSWAAKYSSSLPHDSLKWFIVWVAKIWSALGEHKQSDIKDAYKAEFADKVGVRETLLAAGNKALQDIRSWSADTTAIPDPEFFSQAMMVQSREDVKKSCKSFIDVLKRATEHDTTNAPSTSQASQGYQGYQGYQTGQQYQPAQQQQAPQGYQSTQEHKPKKSKNSHSQKHHKSSRGGGSSSK